MDWSVFYVDCVAEGVADDVADVIADRAQGRFGLVASEPEFASSEGKNQDLFITGLWSTEEGDVEKMCEDLKNLIWFYSQKFVPVQVRLFLLPEDPHDVLEWDQDDYNEYQMLFQEGGKLNVAVRVQGEVRQARKGPGSVGRVGSANPQQPHQRRLGDPSDGGGDEGHAHRLPQGGADRGGSRHRARGR